MIFSLLLGIYRCLHVKRATYLSKRQVEVLIDT